MLYVRSQGEWTRPRERIPSRRCRPATGFWSARTPATTSESSPTRIERLTARWRSTMNTMLRWSPTRQFHFHHDVDDLSERFFGGATDEAAQRPSWLPAAEGRTEDGDRKSTRLNSSH